MYIRVNNGTNNPRVDRDIVFSKAGYQVWRIILLQSVSYVGDWNLGPNVKLTRFTTAHCLNGTLVWSIMDLHPFRLYWRVFCGTVAPSVLGPERGGSHQAGTHAGQLHPPAFPGAHKLYQYIKLSAHHWCLSVVISKGCWLPTKAVNETRDR